jgi:thioesterase domain-containing protein/NAD(P)-dependent dehydrogenase (short-subunit alcohol dehydrogenase family)/acyl carrier protein
MTDSRKMGVGAVGSAEPLTSTAAGSNPQDEFRTIREFSSTVRNPNNPWFYRRAWNRTELPATSSLGTISWVIFMDPTGLGEQISEQLKGAQHQVVEVVPGKTFSRIGKGRYRIRPGHRDDYDSLIVDITKHGSPPQKIVHLWSVCANSSRNSVAETIDLSFYSLSYLAQALGEQDLSAVDIAVISNRLQSVSGEPMTQPVRAALLGPTKALPKTFPGMTCRSIDCDPVGQGISYVAVQIIAEHCAPTREAVVAYRGDERWAETLERVELRGTAKRGGPKDGGVYLITGGLSDIGIVMAEDLARNFRAKLILIHDPPLPAAHESGDLLQGDSTAKRVHQVMRKLDDLRSGGSEVLLVCADVARRDDMERAVEMARQKFGRIDGVIHAEGGLKKKPQTAPQQTSAEVFGLNIGASLVWEDVLRGMLVDFLALLSFEDSSTTPSERIEYEACGAVRDAFAVSQLYARVVSIQLGRCQEPADGEIRGLLPGEGASAVSLILSADAPSTILVSKDDLLVGSQTAGPVSMQVGARTAETVEAVLSGWWQELLNLEQVGLDEDFFELGGHSLIGVQLFSRIKKTYAVDLGLATLFEARTIAQLARLVRPASDIKSVKTVLAGWWQELLGIEHVGFDEDFFELGGHSLIGVQLFSKIKNTYGTSLGLATLFEARTITQLAALIRPDNKPSQPEPRPWSPLVPIQPRGTRPPLYVISGLGGNVIKFHSLAFHLGEGQPIYGLLPRGLDGKNTFHTRIQDVAADYVAAIRSRQPEGPYHLVGYSFGGIVAFEVAQQIAAQGGRVGLLGMFDTIEWHYGDRVDESLRPGQRFHVLQEHLCTIVFSAGRTTYLKKILSEKFSMLKQRVSRALGRPLPQRIDSIEEINSYAATHYYPKAYPGKVTLFRSTKRTIQQGSDEYLGWKELAGGGIEVHHVPGTHFNILQEPAVQVVAEKLQSCLSVPGASL